MLKMEKHTLLRGLSVKKSKQCFRKWKCIFVHLNIRVVLHYTFKYLYCIVSALAIHVNKFRIYRVASLVFFSDNRNKLFYLSYHSSHNIIPMYFETWCQKKYSEYNSVSIFTIKINKIQTITTLIETVKRIWKKYMPYGNMMSGHPNMWLRVCVHGHVCVSSYSS